MYVISALVLSLVSINVKAQITRIDTTRNNRVVLKSSQFKTHRLFMYTLGLKVYGLEEFPKIFNQVESNELRPLPLSGLFFKINDNQISYRLSANFYSKDVSFRNECQDCEEANGDLTDFSAKIGFEKNFLYGPVQPYVAFDIGYRRNSFDGNVRDAANLIYTEPYDVTSLKNGLHLGTGLGIKFNPINHLTIAVESGIGSLYSYEKQERVYQGPNRTRTFNEYKKWEFLLQPVSMVSFQYNFGVTY